MHDFCQKMKKKLFHFCLNPNPWAAGKFVISKASLGLACKSEDLVGDEI